MQESEPLVTEENERFARSGLTRRSAIGLMAGIAGALALVQPTFSLATETTSETADTMWRLYNPYSGEHLYTSDPQTLTSAQRS